MTGKQAYVISAADIRSSQSIERVDMYQMYAVNTNKWHFVAEIRSGTSGVLM